MRWFKRIVLGLVALLVVLLVVGSVAGIWMVRRSFPDVAGALAVPGLEAEVTVHRDAYGVPTIVAQTATDLFRAQGYVHAQDRYWEMDFRRHVTAGRIAELFGDGQVETDAFVRTLGWRRVAEQELDLLDDDTITMLEAYAEGVNAWVGDRSGSALSLEHGLLPVAGARGYEPEPWTPLDSVAWLKAMAWDLRSNLEDELLRGRLQTVDLGAGREWTDLFPDFPYDRHETILDEENLEAAAAYDGAGEVEPDADSDASEAAEGAAYDAALDRAQQALLAAPSVLANGADEGIGSNSWVIAPERSATGGALLANDPHLGAGQPSLWYQVGLQCAEVTEDCPFHVAGFSFAGVPGIVIGQNARIAWGFTNLGPDVADLYVEQVRDGQYLTEDGWQDLEIIEDTLRVAGGDDIPLTIRATRNGPLFSDVSEGARTMVAGLGGAQPGEDGPESPEEGAELAVALRWTALDPGVTMDAVAGFMQAGNFDEFRTAASKFEVPSQNLVYVDVDGHIGYQAPGKIPVRSAASDGTGPVPGWTGEHTWERFLDFEELPFTFDPADGEIITANQPVLPEGAEPFLSSDNDMGHRAQRIHDLLGDRDGLTLEDLAAVQMDNHNTNAEVLLPHLVDLDVEGAEQAQEVLRGWDLQDHADSAGGAVFNAFWRHALQRIFHDELPEWAHPSGGSDWWEIVRGLLDDPEAAWWDDRDTDEVETRDDVLAAALTAAHDEVVDRFGEDADDWRWGGMHTLTLTHATFGESGIAPVEALFNRGPLEVSGGTGIVNANGWNAAEGYEVNWVPSMRYLVDTSNMDAGRWVHLTGQSGRPFHGHYTDQAELWRDGDTFALPFSRTAVEAAAENTLTLSPAD